MPRPITYDKQAVLDGATNLFWEKGYEAVTLQDILQATGFNRHSLYEQFGSKDGLFLAVLKNYLANYRQYISPVLEDEAADLDALRRLFEIRMPYDLKGVGCLMTNTLNDKGCVRPEASALAEDFAHRLEAALYNCLQNAQRKGDIPASKDLRALARYVFVVIQGLGTLSKMGMTKDDMDTIVDNTLAFLKSP